MSLLQARQNARLGVVYLEQAVLEVLSNAEESLTTREITDRADIPRVGYEPSHKNGFTHGALGMLIKRGLVEKCPEKSDRVNYWRLTSKKVGN